MYVLNYGFLPDVCSGVGLLDHMLLLVLVFYGASILFFIVGHTYIPTNSVGECPFLHTLSSIYC